MMHMSKTTVSHRYKWTLREKLILTIPSVLLIGALVYFSMEKGSLSLGWSILLGGWVIIFAMLINLGKDKKKKSRLEAIYDPETMIVSVEGNKIYKHGTNKGDIKDMKTAWIKQIGMNPTMVLDPEDEGKRKIYIPLRVASKEGFREFLVENVLENDSIKKSDEIAPFFEDATKYKR